MSQERLMTAIARIDAALARIEGASGAGGHSGGGHAAGDPGLAARHERLRAATVEAIARLDRLIDAAGAG